MALGPSLARAEGASANDPRSFTQTGFRVDNDAFWDYFLKRGGPRAFGYDLEFAGRDAWLTELWVDDDARNTGAGGTALAMLEIELRPLGVRALHLQVRPENPALRLYERAGFSRSPRLILTRRLA